LPHPHRETDTSTNQTRWEIVRTTEGVPNAVIDDFVSEADSTSRHASQWEATDVRVMTTLLSVTGV